MDPLVTQTAEAFSYAGDDPVNASDPSGLRPAGQGAMCAMQEGVLANVCDENPSAYAKAANRAPWWLNVAVPVGLAGSIFLPAIGLSEAASCIAGGTYAVEEDPQAGDVLEAESGSSFVYTQHAIDAMEDRGISAADVSGAINNRVSFAYNMPDGPRVGFYNPLSNTFVGTTPNGTITTVIDPRNPTNYLKNLIER